MMDIEDLEAELEERREDVEDLKRELAESTDRLSEVRNVLQDLALTIKDTLRDLDS